MGMKTKVGRLFMTLLAIEPEEDDLLQEEVGGGEAQLAPLPEVGQPQPPGEEPVIEAAEPVTLEQPALQAAEAEGSGEETNEEAIEEGDAKSRMDDDIFDVFDEDEVDDTSLQALLQDLEEVDVGSLLRESQAIAEQLRGDR